MRVARCAASDLSRRRQNPARRRRRLTERCAGYRRQARHHSAIRSAHSRTCTECARQAFNVRPRPGRYAGRSAASRRRLPRHHRRPSGCRRSSSSPSSRRAQASPTRCRQPSLSPEVAAVVAGTAWTVASGIVREDRQTFSTICHAYEICPMYSCNAPIPFIVLTMHCDDDVWSK